MSDKKIFLLFNTEEFTSQNPGRDLDYAFRGAYSNIKDAIEAVKTYLIENDEYFNPYSSLTLECIKNFGWKIIETRL